MNRLVGSILAAACLSLLWVAAMTMYAAIDAYGSDNVPSPWVLLAVATAALGVFLGGCAVKLWRKREG